jgi:L-alanine-DL-glutamate epimerase-like enolase superfamily enzyme
VRYHGVLAPSAADRTQIVLVDGHAHFQLPAALRIADALREIQPLWLEDILKMDNLRTLAVPHPGRKTAQVSR